MNGWIFLMCYTQFVWATARARALCLPQVPRRDATTIAFSLEWESHGVVNTPWGWDWPQGPRGFRA